MKRSTLGLALALIVCATSAAESRTNSVTLKERLDILQRSYPTVIADLTDTHIVLRGDTKLIIDDGQQKTHQEKLKNADIEDMLSQVYPIGNCVKGQPKRNFDPGRIRNGTLLRHLYGKTKQAAKADLTKVGWFGIRLPFTRRHGASAALERVKNDLAKLPPKYQKFFKKSAGTFNWRVIAGTKRLSVHSFGAAIDTNVKFTDYWRWVGGKPGKVPKYANKIPTEIVKIFERHGFIWGGKWYHFDTMHFEFRPELIAIGRLAAQRGCP